MFSEDKITKKVNLFPTCDKYLLRCDIETFYNEIVFSKSEFIVIIIKLRNSSLNDYYDFPYHFIFLHCFFFHLIHIQLAKLTCTKKKKKLMDFEDG